MCCGTVQYVAWYGMFCNMGRFVIGHFKFGTFSALRFSVWDVRDGMLRDGMFCNGTLCDGPFCIRMCIICNANKFLRWYWQIFAKSTYFSVSCWPISDNKAQMCRVKLKIFTGNSYCLCTVRKNPRICLCICFQQKKQNISSHLQLILEVFKVWNPELFSISHYTVVTHC